jgi:hypothetical protein
VMRAPFTRAWSALFEAQVRQDPNNALLHGHSKPITSTVVYTALAPKPVQGLLAGLTLWLAGTVPVVEG